MKSITINNNTYAVGDTVFLVPSNGFRWANIGYKCVVKKITPSGYVYVQTMLPKDTNSYCITTHECRIEKDGTYIKNLILTPYSEEYDKQFMETIEKKDYIQMTFKRLKLVKSLNYGNSVKINALLDEIGIDKVSEE